jgi:hypothetical protein
MQNKSLRRQPWINRAPTRIVTTKIAQTSSIIDDMMDKLNLLRAKASALGFSIEGETGRSDP